MKQGKKFDVILMNPPYGSDKNGDRYLHFKFVDKILEICDKSIIIMPFRMITASNKLYNKYREKYSKYIINLEEVPSNLFNDTHMDKVGIYNFSNIKKNNKINITYKDGSSQTVDSLLNVSVFSDYEKNISKYLYRETKPNYCDLKVRDVNIKRNKEKLTEFLNNDLKSRLNKNDVFLLTNLANGGMNGKWISGNSGKIFDNLDDLINYGIESKAAVKNIMSFKTIKEAENCKIALQNNILRWVLYKIQDDQGLTSRLYKYVPDIDWSDDRVKTDEGLIEVSGCPKDKCKEYADYCRKVIEEVDRKKR